MGSVLSSLMFISVDDCLELLALFSTYFGNFHLYLRISLRPTIPGLLAGGNNAEVHYRVGAEVCTG